MSEEPGDDIRRGRPIEVVFDAASETPLSILGRTLEDLNALLELTLMLADPEHDAEPIPRNWRVRRYSRLPQDRQVRIGTVTKSSPLIVEVIVALGIAAWPIVQAIEKAMNLQNQYRLQRLTVREKELDVRRNEIALAREEASWNEDKDRLSQGVTPMSTTALAEARQNQDLDALVHARGADAAMRQSLARLREDLPIVGTDVQPSSEDDDAPT
jgi:hypothetical protein